MIQCHTMGIYSLNLCVVSTNYIMVLLMSQQFIIMLFSLIFSWSDSYFTEYSGEPIPPMVSVTAQSLAIISPSFTSLHWNIIFLFISVVYLLPVIRAVFYLPLEHRLHKWPTARDYVAHYTHYRTSRQYILKLWLAHFSYSITIYHRG